MTNKELHKKAKYYGQQVRKYKNKFIGLLPEIYKRRIYKAEGFNSITEYASKLAGLSHDTVRKVLSLDEKLADKPVLKEQLTSGKVGWSKLNIIADLATPNTQHIWAKHTKNMSKSALESFKSKLKHNNDVMAMESDPGVAPNSDDKALYKEQFENFTVKLSPETITQLKILKHQSKNAGTWNEFMQEVINKINPSSKKQNSSKPNTSSNSRYIPRHYKEKAFEKTNGICSVPTCNKPGTIYHHKTYFAHGGAHEQVVLMCKTCHELEHNSVFDYKFTPILNPDKSTPEYDLNQKFLKQRRSIQLQI